MQDIWIHANIYFINVNIHFNRAYDICIHANVSFSTLNWTFFYILTELSMGVNCDPYLICLSLLSVCLGLVWCFWVLMAASQSDSEFVRHKAPGSSCNMHSCTHAHNHPYLYWLHSGSFCLQFNYISQQALGYSISFHMVMHQQFNDLWFKFWCSIKTAFVLLWNITAN